MFEKGLYELLTQDAGVSALVGSRVYFILQPKGTIVPSVVLSIVATGDNYTFAGASGLRSALVQVDGYASSYYDSRAVSRSVRLLLENYAGNLPDAGATPVLGCIVEKDWDMPFEEGSKGFVYRALLEVRFIYSDTFLPISTPSNPEAVLDGGTGTYDDTAMVTESVLDGGSS
jgi:hypothetical protein